MCSALIKYSVERSVLLNDFIKFVFSDFSLYFRRDYEENCELACTKFFLEGCGALYFIILDCMVKNCDFDTCRVSRSQKKTK